VQPTVVRALLGAVKTLTETAVLWKIDLEISSVFI
jgi:hypothetical protein